PCQGWARSCYLLNRQPISDYVQQTPLDPLVALAHFFVEQQPSSMHIRRRDDVTIRLLYNIAKRVFEGEGALKEVCSRAYTQ
ncbi:hypothetical protein BJV82DRAFT_524398, partial [Fennellomyces sp. T-0311]